jgi:phospholipid/cholesterol/gamma-HCH transport system substrate-binding protein
MNKEIIRNTRLGVFVISGAILLIFGLYSIGRNKNLFGKSFQLISIFRDVNGLTAGNNVRYSGIDIGTIKEIEIINDSSIKVEMLIDEKVKGFISKNSIASVGTDGLMGNKIVNITPGTPASTAVTNNDTIETLVTVNTEEMLRTLDKTNTNISLVSNNLREITESVTNSRGVLYKILMDTVLAKNIDLTFYSLKTVSNNLESTTDYLSTIAGNAKNGKGTLGMLVSDTCFSSELMSAINQVKEGAKKFNEFTSELNVSVNKINSGNGIISGLINDSLLNKDFSETIINMHTATVKLNEDLDGLKHSFLLRGYFKRIEKEKKK